MPRRQPVASNATPQRARDVLQESLQTLNDLLDERLPKPTEKPAEDALVAALRLRWPGRLPATIPSNIMLDVPAHFKEPLYWVLILASPGLSTVDVVRAFGLDGACVEAVRRHAETYYPHAGRDKLNALLSTFKSMAAIILMAREAAGDETGAAHLVRSIDGLVQSAITQVVTLEAEQLAVITQSPKAAEVFRLNADVLGATSEALQGAARAALITAAKGDRQKRRRDDEDHYKAGSRKRGRCNKCGAVLTGPISEHKKVCPKK